jgi:hypothetical protein
MNLGKRIRYRPYMLQRVVAYYARHEDTTEDDPQIKVSACCSPLKQVGSAESCHVVPDSQRWIMSQDIGQVQHSARHFLHFRPNR